MNRTILAQAGSFEKPQNRFHASHGAVHEPGPFLK
jgi:hypothetical protein